MHSRDLIFWEVDVQVDFMLPGGKLYVPGAEKLRPNIRKLTDAVRRDEVFLVSSGDFHPPNDPEFAQFPPHCLKGDAGSNLLPEALADKVVYIENLPDAKLPADLSSYQQIVLEKQTFDVFQTLHACELVDRLGEETRIRCVWRGYGVLRSLRSQRPAATRPTRSRSKGCHRNAGHPRGRSGDLGIPQPGRPHYNHGRRTQATRSRERPATNDRRLTTATSQRSTPTLNSPSFPPSSRASRGEPTPHAYSAPVRRFRPSEFQSN